MASSNGNYIYVSRYHCKYYKRDGHFPNKLPCNLISACIIYFKEGNIHGDHKIFHFERSPKVTTTKHYWMKKKSWVSILSYQIFFLLFKSPSGSKLVVCWIQNQFLWLYSKPTIYANSEWHVRSFCDLHKFAKWYVVEFFI